jgi:hypothetical protein
MGLTAVIFKNGVTNGHTLITDVSAWIITGGRNELGHSVL